VALGVAIAGLGLQGVQTVMQAKEMKRSKTQTHRSKSHHHHSKHHNSIHNDPPRRPVPKIATDGTAFTPYPAYAQRQQVSRPYMTSQSKTLSYAQSNQPKCKPAMPPASESLYQYHPPEKQRYFYTPPSPASEFEIPQPHIRSEPPKAEISDYMSETYDNQHFRHQYQDQTYHYADGRNW
jgi:hypothetical protein